MEKIKVSAIGAVQFGLMYSCFQASFLFLNGHEVALLLISTPMYVVAIDGVLSKSFGGVPVILSIVAALLVIPLMDFSQKFCFRWQGVMLTQICNFSFALGQVLIRRFCASRGIKKVLPLNSLLFLGATVICVPLAIFSICRLSYPHFSGITFLVAALIGTFCCGICHWLWNFGAVDIAIPILAVMNNVQIPLAIIVACMVFGEKIDWPRFIGSGAILIAMLILFHCFPAAIREQEKTKKSDRPK
jgi:drug/metabolite transporter (DMT)-like permease